MQVEEVFSDPGRVTVAFGRIERGVINTGDPVEVIDITKEGEKPLTAVVQGMEMFRRSWDRGEAGAIEVFF